MPSSTPATNIRFTTDHTTGQLHRSDRPRPNAKIDVSSNLFDHLLPPPFLSDLELLQRVRVKLLLPSEIVVVGVSRHVRFAADVVRVYVYVPWLRAESPENRLRQITPTYGTHMTPAGQQRQLLYLDVEGEELDFPPRPAYRTAEAYRDRSASSESPFVRLDTPYVPPAFRQEIY